MSRFIKKLRQISENSSTPMGFKTTTVSPTQLMLLIAALPKSNTTKIAQLTEAEVDAVLIYSQDLGMELQTVQEIAGHAGDIPWGIYPEAVTEEGIERIKEIGGDFLIFVASEASASLLQEEIGKVIKITLPCEEGLIRTIDQLPIDAVLLDFREEVEHLTISQLMNCQWIANSTNKPLLLAVQQELHDREVRALWEAGVKGLVIEIEEKSKTELMRLHQVITALSSASRKPGERRALLPSLEVEEDSVSPHEI